ncbi:MAG: hypothetical protein KDC99_06460 [Cyclobacteriaceae bacterium]|nr:hypothetical protein [Cyclobacteriaceae bacterium]
MDKPICIVVFALVVSSCTTPREETHWNGLISQDDNFGISNSYKSDLRWTRVGDEITGTGYYVAPQDTASHVLYSFEGRVEGDTIRLRETGIIYGTEIKGEWVTKDIILWYAKNSKDELLGTWVAQKIRSIGGKMKYTRVTED